MRLQHPMRIAPARQQGRSNVFDQTLLAFPRMQGASHRRLLVAVIRGRRPGSCAPFLPGDPVDQRFGGLSRQFERHALVVQRIGFAHAAFDRWWTTEQRTLHVAYQGSDVLRIGPAQAQYCLLDAADRRAAIGLARQRLDGLVVRLDLLPESQTDASRTERRHRDIAAIIAWQQQLPLSHRHRAGAVFVMPLRQLGMECRKLLADFCGHARVAFPHQPEMLDGGCRLAAVGGVVERQGPTVRHECAHTHIGSPPGGFLPEAHAHLCSVRVHRFAGKMHQRACHASVFFIRQGFPGRRFPRFSCHDLPLKINRV